MDKRKKTVAIVLGFLVILLVAILGILKFTIEKQLPPFLSAKDINAKYPVLPVSLQSKVKDGQNFFAKSDYVGSETCKKCHQQQYTDWKTTWHSKMERLLKPEEIEGDFNDVTLNMKGIEIPKDPNADKKEFVKADVTIKAFKNGDRYHFTLVDDQDPSNNQTYEITHLIGGAWEQLYEVKVGDNLYPSPIRWVVEDKAWRSKGFDTDNWYKIVNDRAVPRKPGELLNNKASSEAKCAGCHDTGYKPTIDNTTHKVTGLAKEMGIGCEKCHGPGSLHVSSGGDRTKIINPLTDLDALQQNQVCGQCHERVSNKDDKTFNFPIGFLPGDKTLQDRVSFWSYSFGVTPQKLWWPNNFAKSNRQQYQDFENGPHAQTNVSCLTCHTPHGKRVEGLGLLRVDRKDMCSSCHSQQGVTGKPNTEMFQGSVMQQAGVTCVDCHMAKIGQRAAATKVKADHWDVSSHTFIAPSPDMKANWGVRSACDQCHSKDGRAAIKFDKDSELKVYNGITSKAKTDLNDLVTQLDLVEKEAIKQNGPEKAVELITEARNNLNFVQQDGSYGFHNPTKANQLLEEARAKISKAKSKLGMP